MGRTGLVQPELVVIMLGLSAYWLSQAVAFAKSRVVFADRAIYDYQAIQHPFARLHARLHAARLATYRATALFDADAAAAPGETISASSMSRGRSNVRGNGSI